MKRLSLILTTLLYMSVATATDNDFIFRHFATYDGLWANAVRALVQDRCGYIWIGADTGLMRYDGINMRRFTLGNNSSEQAVTSLIELGDSLIIGTFDGAYVLQFSTERITPFTIGSGKEKAIDAHVTSISADSEGGIWFSTMGKDIYRYQPSTGTMKRYSSWKDGRIGQVFVDSHNQVWAVSCWEKKGLWLLNRSNGRFEPFMIDDNYAPPGITIAETSDNKLWLGSWKDGLICFDREGHSLARLLQPGSENYALHTHSITEYKQGQLLLGCDNGMILVDTQKGMSRTFKKDEFDPNSISGTFIYPILVDKEGGIWIGTFYSGLNYVSPSGGRFNTFTHSRLKNSVSGNVVNRFCEDRHHNIWIASDDGGLSKFNPKINTFEHIATGNGIQAESNVHALCIDGDELWIGTYTDGVTVMDINTLQQRRYTGNGSNAFSLYDDSSYSIFKDRRGNIWVATIEGLMLFRRDTDDFKRMKRIREITIDIDEDDKGYIWFSTQGKGIYRYDTKRNQWKQYTTPALPNDVVNCTLIDKDNNIWIATNNGLAKYDEAKDVFVDTKAVENITVYSVIEDNDKLWLTTANGLMKYVEGQQPMMFDTNDGLNSIQFLPNASLMASDGCIYIGTNNGFNSFYSYQIKANPVAPRVVITGMDVMNKQVKVGDERLEKSFAMVDAVNLSYKDKMFSISFASLSYCIPQKNLYAYKLEGFDKAWNNVGHQTRATYTNLPPGTYTFRVKGTNNDGAWSEKETKLKIIIHPPFYLSLPAKIIYVLMVMALVVYLYRRTIIRERRRHEQQMKKLNEEKELEVRNSKIQFFTMVAHEIRTPVSLIIGPLESLMKTTAQLSPAERNNMNIIDRNAHRLLELVNQLLDFRKVEKQTYVVKFKVQNVCDMIHAVSERFEPTFAQNGVKFVTEYPDPHFTAIIDNEAVTKVISNLLTNARKYTRDHVRLSCIVSPDENHFIIEVEDNGVGINKADQARIFEAFYQAADNKPGTGIGLSIVKNIVKQHHGTVEVKSKPGHGSTFIVTLPVRQGDFVPTVSPTIAPQSTPLTTEDKSLTSPLSPLTPHPSPLTPKPTTVLLVDDNDDMLQYLRDNISKSYSVITAHDGIEALDKLQNNEVQLIICDWMMPRMDGRELCRHVRENSETSHIPFIMLTAKTDIDSKAEGMNIGVDAYIEKPFSMKYLEACYNNILSLRRMLRQRYSTKPLEPITEIAQTPVDKELMRKMEEIIEANFANADLSVNFLAEKMCMSRSSLFSKIKTLADMTPNEMIQTVRLKKAAQLLKEGKYKVSEVCYMVGFSNPSYFTKCFQKQFGMKPTEMQESAT